MKLVISLLFILLVGLCIYIFSPKKTKKNKINKKALGISSIVVGLLLLALGYALYSSAVAPDTQCTAKHSTVSKPPTSLKSPSDYFLQGNYNYDTGNCSEAIADYSFSIALNPNFPEAYNNRAYTFMRMHDYKDATSDLDKAIQLRPNYIQALMNRGDIHNYYYQIDRNAAISDYKKAISLGATNQTSVCGHLFLARHNGWNVGTFFGFITGEFLKCN